MYGIPEIDWTTVSATASSPTKALEQFATWLAQDAAIWATKSERGEIPLPEALEGIAEAAGLAEAVGIREEFNQILAGRINEIRTEMAEWSRECARKNGQRKPLPEPHLTDFCKASEINE